jgi:hypothetical protein
MSSDFHFILYPSIDDRKILNGMSKDRFLDKINFIRDKLKKDFPKSFFTNLAPKNPIRLSGDGDHLHIYVDVLKVGNAYAKPTYFDLKDFSSSNNPDATDVKASDAKASSASSQQSKPSSLFSVELGGWKLVLNKFFIHGLVFVDNGSIPLPADLNKACQALIDSQKLLPFSNPIVAKNGSSFFRFSIDNNHATLLSFKQCLASLENVDLQIKIKQKIERKDGNGDPKDEVKGVPLDKFLSDNFVLLGDSSYGPSPKSTLNVFHSNDSAPIFIRSWADAVKSKKALSSERKKENFSLQSGITSNPVANSNLLPSASDSSFLASLLTNSVSVSSLEQHFLAVVNILKAQGPSTRSCSFIEICSAFLLASGATNLSAPISFATEKLPMVPNTAAVQNSTAPKSAFASKPVNTAPKTAPKSNVPTDAPKNAPKTDAPKADAPKTDAPKADAPKTDAPKADAPKTNAPVLPIEVDDDVSEAIRAENAQLMVENRRAMQENTEYKALLSSRKEEITTLQTTVESLAKKIEDLQKKVDSTDDNNSSTSSRPKRTTKTK